MDCIDCKDKICRKQQNSSTKESFDKIETINQYQNISSCEIVKTSAHLVGNDRVGTLSCSDETP